MFISFTELEKYIKDNQIDPKMVRVYLDRLPGLKPHRIMPRPYYLPPEEYAEDEEEGFDEED